MYLLPRAKIGKNYKTIDLSHAKKIDKVCPCQLTLSKGFYVRECMVINHTGKTIVCDVCTIDNCPNFSKHILVNRIEPGFIRILK